MASYMDDEFKQLVYNYNQEAAGISSWKEYLEGLTKQQTSDIETATQQASYDISGAYANYKKAQLNLLQNQQLGAGFKEQLGSGLKSSYASAYGNVQSQLASNISNITGEYDKLRTEASKNIQESASYIDSINRALYEFGGKDISKRGLGREAGGLGYYATDTEGTTRLTPYGKAELSDLLLNAQDGKFFSDYLAETDKKTYDWFMNNLDLAYGTIAGLEPGTRSFTTQDRDIMIAAEDAERKFASLSPEEYDRTKTFESEQARYDYYSNKLFDKSNFIDKYKDKNNAMSQYKSLGKQKYLSNITKELNDYLGTDAISVSDKSGFGVAENLGGEFTIDPSKLTKEQLNAFIAAGAKKRYKNDNNYYFALTKTNPYAGEKYNFTYEELNDVINKIRKYKGD